MTIQHSADGWLATSRGDSCSPVRWWKDPSGLVTVAHGGEVMKAAVIDRRRVARGDRSRWRLARLSRFPAVSRTCRSTPDKRWARSRAPSGQRPRDPCHSR